MKPITDRANRVLAYTNDISPYRNQIVSRTGAVLATFNPKDGPDGRTFDRSGRVIGSGDQRGRFIPEK
jgi:hypothetical protein